MSRVACVVRARPHRRRASRGRRRSSSRRARGRSGRIARGDRRISVSTKTTQTFTHSLADRSKTDVPAVCWRLIVSDRGSECVHRTGKVVDLPPQPLSRLIREQPAAESTGHRFVPRCAHRDVNNKRHTPMCVDRFPAAPAHPLLPLPSRSHRIVPCAPLSSWKLSFANRNRTTNPRRMG